MDARAVAARVLARVLGQRRSLSSTLPRYLAPIADARERAFVQDLCFGVLRWLPRLDFMLHLLLECPLRPKDIDIKALLLIGIYQLDQLETPSHAGVSATVEAARLLRKPWAGGLINAILRRYLRESERILRKIQHSPEALYAHPAWLLDALRSAWPKEWQRIVAANNQRAPLSLRVNAEACTAQAYLKELVKAGIAATLAPHAVHGIVLASPVDVHELPGFESGRVSVQDSAAQLAVPLLDLKAGQRVLDACAAPGGKTTQIQEQEPQLASLTALEADTERLKALKETLHRCRRTAEVLHGDAGDPSQWWNQKPFDRILLDSPCTGTGVIRRHPDIKVLRRQEDLMSATKLQCRLLEALWPLLTRNGKLLYVTCSVLPQENDAQIEHFLQHHPDARPLEIRAEWGRGTSLGRQILPGEDGMDGFFYAGLQKT
ncbi:MAG: 16S rRNA (cytosine(967)-C(5))-methyltransferase RsmB [Gammaproteobacteria bacterium]|nr:16S rRNA (cytosine(967)-C(5))-methyltransferase RsmB [Gammaproteobacteria bacterium]MCI0590575.1 16S rRNA (cytosine(967)-C(5))-methyltransferase RsmB [Gammaproteobacteria bacterium]